MSELADYPSGTHAQIFGLAAKPELNEQYAVSRGVNPENAERLNVATRSGATLSIRPSNLRPAELLPGTRVAVVGLESAAAQKYNSQEGEVLSWEGDRWIVDLSSKERKSFRSVNLVILPSAARLNKRKADEPEVEAKRVKATDIKDLNHGSDEVIARALLRNLREFPLIAQKCVCCLSTKQTVTVMHELAAHMTDKQNDGYIRRPLRPNERVKGIEELDALEQCFAICEKRLRALANMCKIDYCDLFGFIKAGCKEPMFNRPQRAAAP